MKMDPDAREYLIRTARRLVASEMELACARESVCYAVSEFEKAERDAVAAMVAADVRAFCVEGIVVDPEFCVDDIVVERDGAGVNWRRIDAVFPDRRI